jgi:hypothetical protein
VVFYQAPFGREEGCDAYGAGVGGGVV